MPRGFEVLPRDPTVPLTRLYAYIGSVMDSYNEDLAIAFLLPAVAKEDFVHLSEAFKSFFIHDLGVRLLEVQPSHIGDAFVRFSSPVELERFLDEVAQFGRGYTIRFTKHDVGVHVRDHEVDREVWIMLMLFPNDARNNSAISKAVAGFGLLRYLHDSTNNARVMCKIHNDEARIPDDVVVSAGIQPNVHSWTCPVFVLKRKGVDVLGDEYAFPLTDGGIAHPFPLRVPRWVGLDGPNPPHNPVSDQHVDSDSVHGLARDADQSDAGDVRSDDRSPAGIEDLMDVENAPGAELVQVQTDPPVVAVGEELPLSLPVPALVEPLEVAGVTVSRPVQVPSHVGTSTAVVAPSGSFLVPSQLVFQMFPLVLKERWL